LNDALVRRDQVDGIVNCPREESFSAMYAALGDREQQNDIRRRWPDKRHCVYLRKDANACECLPPGIREGEVCPNNPYDKHAVAIERLGQLQQVLTFAENAYRALMTGGLNDEAWPSEVQAGLIFQDWIQQRWRKF
jgi:hypothetical protein